MTLSPSCSVTAGAAAILVFISVAVGCSNKMSANDCGQLRSDAFELLNKAQHCNVDVDCRQSDWPGCSKPQSLSSREKIQPIFDAFKKGQCEEPKSECREPPPVYCKQGLCVHREKGTPEGAGNTPTDQIEVK